MNKTIKINLGGTLFQIDEEAYKILRTYLQAITDRLRNTPGAAETVEDIEVRIAELFTSQGPSAGVISKDNVEAMMAVIGKPEDFYSEDTGSQNNEPYRNSNIQKKLYRNPDDQIISGVSSGLGAYMNIDAVWVRLLFVIFTFFFGIGFFVYLALWIALPTAFSDHQKMEMYGRSDYISFMRGTTSSGQGGPAIGSAINEVFSAIGKVLFVIMRIFLIIFGTCFVLAGFLSLVVFVMVFIFKYPGYFSTTSMGVNLVYLPDFLTYIVNPAITPWIIILSSIVILLPLLAMIYWGVKMIFWFRAKDGIVSLIALILWVVSMAVLSILLFNEGISFAETGRIVKEERFEKAPGDIYIFSGKKISDLKYDKQVTFHEDYYSVYFIDGNKGLYIGTNLNFNNPDDNSVRLSVKKRSAGRSRLDAQRKAEELIYDYRIDGDTIRLDEYFTIPEGTKWTADEVRVTLYIPTGTRVHFDKTTEQMYWHRYYDSDWWTNEDDQEISGDSFRYDLDYSWIMTDDGLRKKASQEK